MRCLFLFPLIFTALVTRAQTIPQVNNVPWYEFSRMLTIGERLGLPQDTTSLPAGATVRKTNGLVGVKNGVVYYLNNGAWQSFAPAWLADSIAAHNDRIKLLDAQRSVMQDTLIAHRDSLTALRNRTINIAGVVGGVQYKGNDGHLSADSSFKFEEATKALHAKSIFLDSMNLKEIPGATIDTLKGFGDSFTVGYNASPQTINGYLYRMGAYWGVPIVNMGVSGSGVWKVMQQNYLTTKLTHKNANSIMAGFNDSRRGGSDVRTRKKILNAYKAFVANCNLKSFIDAGATSANITRSGAWLTTYASASVGGKSTNNGAYTNTAGDYVEYSFTDSTVVVGLIGADGTTTNYDYSTIDVTIDGTLVETVDENNQWDGISDGSNDNKRGPFVLIYRGLGLASHTIRITAKSSKYTVVDYFGHLRADIRPTLLWHIPLMQSAGYAISPANGSAALTNDLNAAIDSLAATLAGRCIVVKTNDYYNLTTGLDADNIHPNNTGHQQLFNAATAVYSPGGAAIGVGTLIYNGYRFSTKGKELAYLDDVSGFSGVATPNYLPRFNSATTIAPSSIQDNGSIVSHGLNSIFKSNAVSIGTYSAGVAGVNIGKINGTNIPMIGLFKSDNTTNQKNTDLYSGVNFFEARFTDDANTNANPWMTVYRSGYVPDSMVFYQKIRIRQADSVATPTGGFLFRDAITKEVKITAGYLTASATVDLASVAAGAYSNIDITVTGVAAGDPVVAGMADTGAMEWSAYCPATNTVRIAFHNTTGSAVDLPSQTYKVKVLK